jgi:putative flippase GtrA
VREKLLGIYDVHGEKLRYLVVGVVNTIVGYLMFVGLLASLGVWLQTVAGSSNPALSYLGRYYYLVVQWVSWVFMVPWSTTTMKHFAFRSKGNGLHEIGKAYFVYLPAQGVSSVLLWLTVKVMHLSPAVGQIAAIAFATVFSYLGHKYFTFRVQPDDVSAAE